MEDESEVSENESSRRRVLKTIGGVGAAGATVGAVSGNAAAEEKTRSVYYAPADAFRVAGYQEESYYYSFSADDWYRVDFVVDCIGGYTKNASWGWTFRVFSTGARRRYDPSYSDPVDDPDSQKIKRLEGHRLSFLPTDNGVNSTFAEKSGKGYIGGWPTPQYTALEAAEDIVENTAEYVVSELNKYASVAIAAKNMHENISQEYDENTSDPTGESVIYNWPYGGSWFSDKQSDINQYNEIDYQQPYGTTDTFYAKSEMWEGSINPEMTWEVTVEAPDSESDAPSTSSTISTSSDSSKGGEGSEDSPQGPPDDFPAGTKERFGLRKVPIKKLEEAGIDVTDPHVVDGNKTWWASKPQGQIRLVPEGESPV